MNRFTILLGDNLKRCKAIGLVVQLQYKHLRIHKECEDLRTELLQYPRGNFKDLADSTEMFCRISRKPGVHKVQRKAKDLPGTGEYEIAQLERGNQSGLRRLANRWKL